jgi:hypothetical protein
MASTAPLRQLWRERGRRVCGDYCDAAIEFQRRGPGRPCSNFQFNAAASSGSRCLKPRSQILALRSFFRVAARRRMLALRKDFRAGKLVTVPVRRTSYLHEVAASEKEDRAHVVSEGESLLPAAHWPWPSRSASLALRRQLQRAPCFSRWRPPSIMPMRPQLPSWQALVPADAVAQPGLDLLTWPGAVSLS